MGNESGYVWYFEWSVVLFMGMFNLLWKSFVIEDEVYDLVGFELLVKGDYFKWYLVEVDVLIWLGWFY